MRRQFRFTFISRINTTKSSRQQQQQQKLLELFASRPYIHIAAASCLSVARSRSTSTSIYRYNLMIADIDFDTNDSEYVSLFFFSFLFCSLFISLLHSTHMSSHQLFYSLFISCGWLLIWLGQRELFTCRCSMAVGPVSVAAHHTEDNMIDACESWNWYQRSASIRQQNYYIVRNAN